jgi:hypothetical protein
MGNSESQRTEQQRFADACRDVLSPGANVQLKDVEARRQVNVGALVVIYLQGWKPWSSRRTKASLRQALRVARQGIEDELNDFHTVNSENNENDDNEAQFKLHAFALDGCAPFTCDACKANEQKEIIACTSSSSASSSSSSCQDDDDDDDDEKSTVDCDCQVNDQTLEHRLRGCLLELKNDDVVDVVDDDDDDDEKDDDKAEPCDRVAMIRDADRVLVVGHSQGGVLSVLLCSALMRNGTLRADQCVTVLSLSGVHHGTFDRAGSMGRVSTQELCALSDPRSRVFAEVYLPALRRVLGGDVRLLAVAAFNDTSVSLCSATIDGVEHPNVTRALWLQDKYFGDLHALQQAEGEPDEWRVLSGDGTEFFLALNLLSVYRRNAGNKPLDFARFVRRGSSLSASALGALPEMARASMQLYRSSGSMAEMATALASLPRTLSRTTSTVVDSQAHVRIHESAGPFRWAVRMMLDRPTTQALSSPPPPPSSSSSPSSSQFCVRDSFDIDVDDDNGILWQRFADDLLSLSPVVAGQEPSRLERVEPLMLSFASALYRRDEALLRVHSKLVDALEAVSFHEPSFVVDRLRRLEQSLSSAELSRADLTRLLFQHRFNVDSVLAAINES